MQGRGRGFRRGPILFLMKDEADMNIKDSQQDEESSRALRASLGHE